MCSAARWDPISRLTRPPRGAPLLPRQLIFVMMVFYSLYSETSDYVEIYRATGQPLAHFNSLWNVLDAISISMNLASISIWVFYIVLQQGFDMKV